METPNPEHNKKKLSTFRQAGIITLSLVGGLLVAGGIIYLANNSNSIIDASNEYPLRHLLNQQSSETSSLTNVSCNTQTNGMSPASNHCVNRKKPDACLSNGKALCADDLEIARIAWIYFQKNYNPETGLYNSAHRYTSTTMWDTGSAIAATIAAKDFGFIDKKEFDDRIMAMYKTLNTMELFNKEAPNKAYNSKTAKMVDYRNKAAPEGIGVSILDLGRLVSWLNTLQCMHPKYQQATKSTIERWDTSRLLKDGQMYGLARDEVTKKIKVLQEGRLGYEQYTGKVFRNLGFDMHIASTYNNKHRRDIEIMDVSVAYDNRDPRKFGANNYVITESYTMDATENGLDSENRPLLRNIYDVQKERWRRTGIVTAVSEDNINRKPWFLYNSIFNAGIPWSTINPRGTRFDELKTVSTKAALSMAVMYPEDAYSQVLMGAIESAYSLEKGWYSGVYENGTGYNTTATANTNGNIMANMLYKKYGSFYELCDGCKRMVRLKNTIIKESKPCNVCEVSTIKKATVPIQYAEKTKEE